MTPTVAVLLALGVSLVAFGAVVLLRYSDRPGGSLKLLGVEISSAGAGLPLVALGVLCVVLGVQRVVGGASGASGASGAGVSALAATPADTSLGCLTTVFPGLAADRVVSVEAGMRDVDVLRPQQRLDAPFGLVFTENGRRVAGLRVRLHRASDGGADLYRVEAAVDGACRPLATLRNESRGGDPTALMNWDTLRFRTDGQDYAVRIGGETGVSVGYFTRVQ